jgi:hypothetical protein
MTGDLFAASGPEGRNEDSDDFERRLNLVAAELGYTVVEVNIDTLVGETARSQGLDSIWAYRNPRTGRGDGWLAEAKRHDGPGRYTPAAMTNEIQLLRDKVRRLGNQRQRFFDDPEIAQHIEVLRGGILAHRTPGYNPEKTERVLADVQTIRNEIGSEPVRVPFWGPDSLNGLAEAFDRFGDPAQFWWPITRRHDGIWARPCPPEQIAAGLVLYRTHDNHRVLVVRDRLSRHDPGAIKELAWRMGENLHVVAFTHGTIEERRLASAGWHRAYQGSRELDKGRLPERTEVLGLGHDSLGAFERRWDPERDAQASSSSPPRAVARQTRRPGRLEAAPTTLSRRRRAVSAYPSPASVALTFTDKASLHGSKRFLAREGNILFADDRLGTSRAAEEIWLRPSAYRTMGHMLDMTPLPTVAGFTLVRLPQSQQRLDGVQAESLIEEFTDAAAQRKGEPFDAERCIRLRDLQTVDGTWPLSLELVYDHIFDLVGGERVFDEAQVEVCVRVAGSDELELAIITTREGDFAAGAAWLGQALGLAQRGWLLSPAAVPHSEPRRSEMLRTVVDGVADGRLLGLSSPHQHRDRSTPRPADGFPRILRGAHYDTEFSDLDTVLQRGREDNVVVSEISVYLCPAGIPAAAVALRLRQRGRDAHLFLRWQAGRLQTSQAPTVALDRDMWEMLNALEWSYDQKRSFVLEAWARIAEALRGADAAPVAVAHSA